MAGFLAPLLGGLTAAAFWNGLRAVAVELGRKALKAAPSAIAYVVGGLGLYFFVVEPASDVALDWVVQHFNGAPGTVLETIYYLDVDNYVSAILSAYSARTVGDILLKAKVKGQGG